MASASRVAYKVLSDGASAAAERRRHPRKPVQVYATLVSEHGWGGMNGLQVLVHDLSKQGLAFRSPVGFASGETYLFRIGTVESARRIRVRNCRKRADGAYDVGAELLD